MKQLWEVFPLSNFVKTIQVDTAVNKTSFAMSVISQNRRKEVATVQNTVNNMFIPDVLLFAKWVTKTKMQQICKILRLKVILHKN